MNSVVLKTGDRKEGSGVWVAMVLPLFKPGCIWSKGCQNLAFLQYIEVTRGRDIADEALRSVFLTWSTCDEVDYRLRQVNDTLGCRGLSVGQWFGMKLFRNLEFWVSIEKEIHAIESFFERTPWSMHLFIWTGLIGVASCVLKIGLCIW